MPEPERLDPAYWRLTKPYYGTDRDRADYLAARVRELERPQEKATDTPRRIEQT